MSLEYGGFASCVEFNTEMEALERDLQKCFMPLTDEQVSQCVDRIYAEAKRTLGHPSPEEIAEGLAKVAEWPDWCPELRDKKTVMRRVLERYPAAV